MRVGEQKRFVVLFAEDNEDDVFLLRRAFERTGLDVDMHRAKDGRETVEYLEGAGKYADRQRYPIPMVLVLDLMMPGLHGVEVIRWVRAESGVVSLPILVASDSIRRAEVERAMRAGASWFIRKQWDFKQIAGLVSLLKALWKGGNWEERPEDN